MPRFRFSAIVIISCLILFFISIPFSFGQDVVAAGTTSDAEDDFGVLNPYKILVGVSEVSLDVVVVDKKGRPITDLTADDFEVYQDKRQQQVTSGIYISNQADPSAWPSTTGKKSPNLPEKTLKEEEVRRTIVFLFDDIAMSFIDLHRAKQAVGHFLEKQMEPGDLVSVMLTSGGNSASDMFYSDKRLISARIDGLRGFFGDFYASEDDPKYRVYESQLLSLSYSIRALNDMPGRKILLFLTPITTVSKPLPVIFSKIPTDYTELYNSRYDILADEAMRAGVVVHLLDIKGLIGCEPGNCSSSLSDTMGIPNPLPAKTGGILLHNSNFFISGIGKDVNNMIAGYYLVSYIPPQSTFDTDRYGRDVYHRVQIKVKRKDAVVHTREGFYGRTESRPGFTAQEHPLQAAVFSPFLNSDISVNMAAGYISNAKAEYILRAWVHIDPKDVEIAEMEDGSGVIKLDVVCLTTGVNGNIYDNRSAEYTLNIALENKYETITRIQEQGIKFSVLLPVKKPGAYSVRIAVQDAESGKVGSTYQFVEVPDLTKKKMALSDIFMITGDEDLAWMRSDVTKELVPGEGLFFPVMHKDATRSPALRTFIPGDNLRALTMIYNADPKAVARSEIKTQYILYKDGEEFTRGDPRLVIGDSSVDSLNGIPVLQRLTLGTEMTPGDYVLQLRVFDKKDIEKDSESNENKPEGLFSKIIRAYLNEPVSYGKRVPEGRKFQALSFKIIESSGSVP